MKRRKNPSHTYQDELTPQQVERLSSNLYAVMQSAFKDFPIPSRSEVRGWLTDSEVSGFLFTYSEQGSDDKFGPLKSFIVCEKSESPEAFYQELGIDGSEENINELLNEYPLLKPFRSQFKKFFTLVEKIYSEGKYILDVSYFAAVSDDGEEAQKDYAARVFLTFLRQIVLDPKERPVIWGHMRKESYDLFTKERLKKVKYTKIFEEVDNIVGEDVTGVVLIPDELIEAAKLNVFMTKITISAIMKVINLIS